MEYVPLKKAVDAIVSAKSVTRETARRVLVATFLEKNATPICESYWCWAEAPDEIVDGLAPHDNAVPADFWHLQHYHHAPKREGVLSSGYQATWGDSCDFRVDFSIAGYLASSKYPEFEGLRRWGLSPIAIHRAALDVRISVIDLEGIVARGKFGALIKRAERQAAMQTGNMTKSDAERVWARLCSNCLYLGGFIEEAQDPAKVLAIVQSTSTSVSPEDAVSDPWMRKIANMIAEEAQLLAARSGPPIKQ